MVPSVQHLHQELLSVLHTVLHIRMCPPKVLQLQDWLGLDASSFRAKFAGNVTAGQCMCCREDFTQLFSNLLVPMVIFKGHSMQPTFKSIAWETFHWTHKTMSSPWKANVSSQRHTIVICQMKYLWHVTVRNVPLAPVLVEKETCGAACSVNARKTVSARTAKTLMVLFWQSKCD